jgi:glutamine amidotransferase
LLHSGLKSGSDYYFLHSFRILPQGLPGNIGKCFYGEEFLASYEYENIYATQFHPEKSQINGLSLLNNFFGA